MLAATLGSLADGAVFRVANSDQLYLATDRREGSDGNSVRYVVNLWTGTSVRLIESSPIIEVDGEFVEGATS